MHYFHKLEVWQRARKLCKSIYSITKTYPKSEMFGLSSQIQRASVSIVSNIAEGAGRMSNKEFVHFLSISNGSAFELETQVYLSKDLEYINDETEKALVEELQIIQKMLYKLIQAYSS
jgi:four helix bundle protein